MALARWRKWSKVLSARMLAAVPTRKNPTIPSSRYTAPTADEQHGAHCDVHDVVEGVHLEDSEKKTAVGRDEADAARDEEAEQTDDDVDRAEDGSDEAVG